MKTFTDKEYEKLDSGMKYLQEKLEAVKKYNKENNTNFKFVNEFIFKLYSQDYNTVFIGGILGIGRDSVLKRVRKMGGDIKKQGGAVDGAIFQKTIYLLSNHQTKQTKTYQKYLT